MRQNPDGFFCEPLQKLRFCGEPQFSSRRARSKSDARAALFPSGILELGLVSFRLKYDLLNCLNFKSVLEICCLSGFGGDGV